MSEVYDYIVVGGGASGSVVASRLAEAGASVLLLEAGVTDRRLDVIVPGLVGSAYQKVNWKYPVEPDLSRIGAPEAQMAGKVLGGGGSINSCVYVRGNRADFDRWAELGCEGWSYNDVLPAFKKLESWEGGRDAYRGGDGPISVVVQRDHGVANRAFYEAAQQAGYPPAPDYNGAGQDGVSFVQVNMRRGRRSQASREYLARVAPANRVTIRTEAEAARILFEASRAVGVEYEHEGKLQQAFAGQEVILSAGAYGSPKLLKLSGIGPHAELERLGIEILADVPGVGENLHDHPVLMQRWLAKGVRTMNKMGPVASLRGLVDYVVRGAGFLAMTAVPMQVMAKSSPSLPSPDLQLCFCNFSISRETDESGMFNVQLTKEQGFFASSIFLHPRSRGSVTLRSASFHDFPIIDLRFFDHPEDLRDLLIGLHEVSRIMSQPAMKAITNGKMEPEASCKTDADWEGYARRMTHSAHHPVGTCKMGVDDMAVVDPKLRVRGVQGVRVADASIMPTITSGNTNAPAMMIGERAAEIILSGRNAVFEPARRRA